MATKIGKLTAVQHALHHINQLNPPKGRDEFTLAELHAGAEAEGAGLSRKGLEGRLRKLGYASRKVLIDGKWVNVFQIPEH